MRIVMIGPFGLFPKGTMRMRALPLAQELAARGHEVKLLMPPWHTPEETTRSWQDGGVIIEYVALGPRLPLISYLIVTCRLFRKALAWEPDIIHCFKPKAYAGLVAWLVWQAKRLGLTRARLVIDEDDWEGPGGWNDLEPYSRTLQRIFAWQERWGLRHNDAITVASRALESLAWSLGISPHKVFYLPNGAVSRDRGDGTAVRTRYGLGQAPVVLLYTRFFEYDIARIISVFREVLAELPAARLLVVGKGLFSDDDARFDHLVSEHGLGEQIVRAGWVPQEHLPDYFAAADIALYPMDDTLVNRTKCAVKLLDLLIAGVPVVADAVGQNAEYVLHNETGLLVPSGDAQAMAEAALCLLHDDALCQRLSSAAMAHIDSRYTWSVLVNDLIAAYQPG